jgi:hypothetical protein
MVVNGATKHGDMAHFDAQLKEFKVGGRAVAVVMVCKGGDTSRVCRAPPLPHPIAALTSQAIYRIATLPPFPPPIVAYPRLPASLWSSGHAPLQASRGAAADVSYEYLHTQNLVALQGPGAPAALAALVDGADKEKVRRPPSKHE